MRKVLNRLFVIASVLALMPCLLFAQDSTTSGGLNGVISKIPEWVPIVILSLYELLARVVPTSKNWSILSFVINIIKFIFPNKSTDTYQITNLNSGESKTTKTRV